MHCGVFQCISVGFGVFRCISVFTLTEKGCKKFVSNLFTYFNFIFFLSINAFIQSFHISTCTNYAYLCKLLTFRELL